MKSKRKIIAYGILTVAMVVIGVKIYLKGFSEIDDKVLGEALKLIEITEASGVTDTTGVEVEKALSSYLGIDWSPPLQYEVENVLLRKVRGARIAFVVLGNGENRLVMAIYRVRNGRKKGFLGTANQVYGERGRYSFYISEVGENLRMALISEMDVSSLYRIARRDFFLRD